MKHNTHIYLAAKGIEFLYESLENLRYATTNRRAVSATISKRRREGKVLQRMLMHYQDAISEASWAPDDILSDKVMQVVYLNSKEVHEVLYNGVCVTVNHDNQGCDNGYLDTDTHAVRYMRTDQ